MKECNAHPGQNAGRWPRAEASVSEPKIWPWAKEVIFQYRKKIILIGIAAFMESGIGIAIPLLWQSMIDSATSGRMDYNTAALFGAIMCVSTLPILSWLREWMLIDQSFHARGHVFQHLLKLSIPFFRSGNSDSGKSTKMALEIDHGVRSGVRILQCFSTRDIISDLLIAVFGMIFVAKYSKVAAVILIGFWAVFFFLSIRINKRVETIEEKREETDKNITDRQQEAIGLIELVKLYQAEGKECDWHKKQGETLKQLESQSNWLNSCFNAIDGMSRVLPFCVSLVLFLPRVVDGQLTVGLLIALQMYSSRAVAPAGFLGRMYLEIKKNAASLKPMLRLLQQQPTVAESPSPKKMQQLDEAIKLENVTFRYPGTTTPAIHDVTLTIKKGEKVAIVGPTGSGKSTLARLLVRFYDPELGLITADGKNLREMSFESLYREICYVTQEATVMSGTIRENITYGLRDCSAEQVASACDKAAVDFAIDDMCTYVGENGCQLSGGQRQRLVLARIFLRQPSVIILDEATASLDQPTEQKIMDIFDSMVATNEKKTFVVIAHRLSTVRNANRIVVMDNGAVVAIGTHEDLTKNCELYKTLARELSRPAHEEAE